MKPVSRSRLAVAVLAAAVLVPAGLRAQGTDLAGEWDVTINSPQGTNQVLLTLRREGDAWTGTLKGQRGERPLHTVSVKGNEVQFAMKAMLQGQEAIFSYTGTLEKGAMKGTADFGGFATGDWSAVRHVAAPAGAAAAAAPIAAAAPAAAASSTAAAAPAGERIDISGSWVFNVETSAGSGQPTFTFKLDGEKLTGTYSGAFGTANIAGTLKGSELKFSFTADAGGQTAEITYSGKVQDKDNMQGTVSIAGFGDGSWTGKRK
jgi:hypothetical protein